MQKTLSCSSLHYQIRSQVGLFPSRQISFVLFSVARWLDHFPVPWPSVSPEGRLHAVARLLRPPHLRVGMHHRAPRNHGENHLGIVIITSLNFEMIRPVVLNRGAAAHKGAVKRSLGCRPNIGFPCLLLAFQVKPLN